MTGTENTSSEQLYEFWHGTGQMGPGRRRSRPHPPRSDQQRRLRSTWRYHIAPRAPAPLSRTKQGNTHSRRLSGYLTPEELHPP